MRRRTVGKSSKAKRVRRMESVGVRRVKVDDYTFKLLRLSHNALMSRNVEAVSVFGLAALGHECKARMEVLGNPVDVERVMEDLAWLTTGLAAGSISLEPPPPEEPVPNGTAIPNPELKAPEEGKGTESPEELAKRVVSLADREAYKVYVSIMVGEGAAPLNYEEWSALPDNIKLTLVQSLDTSQAAPYTPEVEPPPDLSKQPPEEGSQEL